MLNKKEAIDLLNRVANRLESWDTASDIQKLRALALQLEQVHHYRLPETPNSKKPK